MYLNSLLKFSQKFNNYVKFSTVAKTNIVKKPLNKKTEILDAAFSNISIKIPEDWNNIRQFILNHEYNKTMFYNANNIDAIIMEHCLHSQNLEYAKNYWNYLNQQNIKPNLATIGRYLTFLSNVNKNDKISNALENEILDIWNSIKKDYPVLDSTTSERIISAVSLTNEWEKCLDMLIEVKRTANPHRSTYSAIITAAFRNKKDTVAWNLLNEMLELDKEPQDSVYLAYLKSVKTLRKKENIVKKLEDLFLFLREHELILTQGAVDYFVKHLKVSASAVTVKQAGHCKHCNSTLEKLHLTKQEFIELKDLFFKEVIIGKDIFLKSNPTEMETFKKFLTTMGNFDVILDGLNVAYTRGVDKGARVFVENVAKVISYFVKEKKSILMLGRQHMNRWSKDMWQFIKQNSTVFLTQNISEDDPYLLYCALHSGPNTIIVTRDLMRGHKFLLKERKFKLLFNRWLSQRRYQIIHIDESKPIFQIPSRFSPVAQKNGKMWHIPYSAETDEVPDAAAAAAAANNVSHHKKWLCVDLEKQI